MLGDLWRVIDLHYLILSALLFLIGMYVGPTAVERDITFLLKYPRWMFGIMRRWVEHRRGFGKIFLLIFLANNLSLFSSFASGLVIVGPVLAAFMTGFNVAVISFDLMGWRSLWFTLINPVAWLEFPAAWLSFALGFKLAEYQWLHGDFTATWQYLLSLLPVYGKYVMSLLLIAAVLETAIIVATDRLSGGSGEE